MIFNSSNFIRFLTVKKRLNKYRKVMLWFYAVFIIQRAHLNLEFFDYIIEYYSQIILLFRNDYLQQN